MLQKRDSIDMSYQSALRLGPGDVWRPSAVSRGNSFSRELQSGAESGHPIMQPQLYQPSSRAKYQAQNDVRMDEAAYRCMYILQSYI